MNASPADLRAEVANYDRFAAVSTWDGPRYRLKYRVLGDGPSLVLVPGIASTYRGYAILLNRLSERFETVLYDYPGENRGDGARLSKIGHEDLADDLLGLIDHLGLVDPVPIGVSFGSTVTLRALHRAPTVFSKGVTQGGFAFRGFRIEERLALRLGRLFPGTVGRLPFRGPVLAANSRGEFRDEIADRWPLYLEENALTPIASMAHRVSLLGQLDLRPMLPAIPAEVLLIHGDRDRIVPRIAFDVLASSLPHGRPVLMAGVGHQPHYTHAEEFASAVAEFAAGSAGIDAL